MSQRGLILFLVAILSVQLSVGTALATAKAANVQSSPLIDQLNPTDKCAWWNTSNPAECTASTISIPMNTDPWGLGDDDPSWNYNGPGNGNWGEDDPNSPFSTGNWGGGTPSTDLGFVDRMLKSILTANYSDEVVEDMNEHGIWNSETQDAVADEIINKYSGYATSWSIGASAGIALLDYLFLGKWRGTGPISGPISTVVGGGLILTAGMGEAFNVMRMQISMLLEIMELYGELPSNPVQRSSEASLAMTTGLGGPALNLAVNRILKLVPLAGAVPPGAPPTLPTFPLDPGAAGAGAAPAAGNPFINETLIGQSGISASAEAEKAVPEIMAKSGLLSAATNRFGGKKVMEFLAAHTTLFKVAASTAFAAVTTYGITEYMGKHYKKKFRKLAKLHEHNVLEAFKNNSDAKQAIWLILTKDVFRKDKTDDALTDQDAKLYATIISQKIPLLHYGSYNEKEALFRQYKASGEDPEKLKVDEKPTKVVAAPTPKPTPDIFGGFGGPITPSPTPKPMNEIDKKLARLNRDLDLQQKLYFIKLIESGMLMKGFLSSRDNETVETIGIELGINPPPKLVLKDNDPRKLVHAHYKALRDGLVGEVRKKVLAASVGASAQNVDAIAAKLPPGDLRYSAGEVIMEDFYNPEQQLINKWAERSNISGVIDQKDFANFKEIDPYLEGDKKITEKVVLPPTRTADGSPAAKKP